MGLFCLVKCATKSEAVPFVKLDLWLHAQVYYVCMAKIHEKIEGFFLLFRLDFYQILGSISWLNQKENSWTGNNTSKRTIDKPYNIQQKLLQKE